MKAPSLADYVTTYFTLFDRFKQEQGNPASWRKSAYHGWVYGYSLHLSCNRAGFPKLAQIETASISESEVLEQKQAALFAFLPEAIVGDNAYFKALRIRS